MRTSEALHELLAERLGLSQWYEGTWDAFWESISDSDLILNPVLRIHGFDALRARLPRDAEILRDCLENLPRERDDVQVEWVE